jgi:type I restriction enzyme S subunit
MNLNTGIINPTRIPLPPTKAEQEAIAEALSDADTLIESLEQLIAKKRNLKQGAMQELLTGKRRLPGFSGEWEVCNLGDKTIKIGSGITPTGGERVYKKEGRPFLRSQNVGWGCLLMEDIAFIDDETHETFLGTEVEGGDVFLNITGASIGRCAVSDARVEGGNVNQHVCIIRPRKEQLNSEFLSLFLLSKDGQKQIDSFQAGGNRQGLNFGQIRSFQLRAPSLPEQTAIAAILSDMDAGIAALERKRDKTRLLKQGMMQELLTGRIRLV